MLTVYGSRMCPDCRALKKNLDFYGISYNFLDITENLKHLKEFLILRDTKPVFDHLKAVNDIGIPAVVLEDGTVLTDWEGYLQKNGYQVLPEDAGDGKACSLDRKGC